jgi:hypothetical protein
VYITGRTWSPTFPVSGSAIQPDNANPVTGNVFVTKLSGSGSPSLVYSTYLGGTGGSVPPFGDVGLAIAVDSSGNAYVTGETASSDFPVLAGFQGAPGGESDAFVTKINPFGSAIVYSTYLGGSKADRASSIAVDSALNVYLTGDTGSTNFPTAVPLQSAKKTPAAAVTAFVTKLNPAGSNLVYSTYLGGTGEESGVAIVVDTVKSAYVMGTTSSTDFPLAAALQAANAGGQDLFIAKLSPAGSALSYATYLGGSGFELGGGMALGAAGTVYLTGSTLSTDFPITPSALQSSTTALGFTPFVAKVNAAGSMLIYSTYLGGTVEDFGEAVAADSSGNAYVTGSTSSPDFPALAPLQGFNGGVDAFVTKLNPTGSALLYATYLGGVADDNGTGIVVDAAQSAFVLGQTGSVNFPTPGTALQPFLAGDSDAFVSKLASSGSYPPIKPKVALDGVLMAASSSNSASCGGVAFDATHTVAVHELNGKANLQCPGCDASANYAIADWRDVLKLAFFGIHHDQAATRDCDSDVRRSLVAAYGNIFQTACGAGSCAGKPLHHLWRLADASATTAAFASLLGTDYARFCNVGNTLPANTGPGFSDYLDDDPIRIACDGTGSGPGEQACGSGVASAFNHLGTLGLLLPITVPDPNEVGADPYASAPCTPGENELLPCTKTTCYGNACPAGNGSFGGKCWTSVIRNPAPGVRFSANCLQIFRTGSCPYLTPAGIDCRGANLWLRRPDGSLVKNAAGRPIIGAFYRIHNSAAQVGATGPCRMATGDEQIACLVGNADTCSMGFASRAGIGIPLPPNTSGLAVKGIVPDDPSVYYASYPLAY